MKVFKFGGASVKNAEAVKNVADIIKNYPDDQLIIIVSAMGKTTNGLEELLQSYFHGEDTQSLLEGIKGFHFSILDELFTDKKHPIYTELHNTFVEVEWQLEDNPVGTYDFEYDQMVSLGEQISTKIIAAYLKEVGVTNKWLDARDVVRTDNTYRKANIDWPETDRLVKEKVDFSSSKVWITQGFIGSTSENFTTTLGREGSDFSAAIFANILQAEEVVIWKDVEGMLNADPKYYENTVKLNNISYKETVELAYYGASVIHPKTIKPLQNKRIPLYVKSFINPKNKGSLINDSTEHDHIIPSYIHKSNQCLITIASKDYAFMTEEKLSVVFKSFAKQSVSINIMQNSAISFSVCVDYEQLKVEDLLNDLSEQFTVTYNHPCTLITIRHYSDEIVEELIGNKTVLLEQKTRNTARFAIRD